MEPVVAQAGPAGGRKPAGHCERSQRRHCAPDLPVNIPGGAEPAAYYQLDSFAHPDSSGQIPRAQTCNCARNGSIPGETPGKAAPGPMPAAGRVEVVLLVRPAECERA